MITRINAPNFISKYQYSGNINKKQSEPASDYSKSSELLPNYGYNIFFTGKTSPFEKSLNTLFEKYSSGILFDSVKPEFINNLAKKLEKTLKEF